MIMWSGLLSQVRTWIMSTLCPDLWPVPWPLDCYAVTWCIAFTRKKQVHWSSGVKFWDKFLVTVRTQSWMRVPEKSRGIGATVIGFYAEIHQLQWIFQFIFELEPLSWNEKPVHSHSHIKKATKHNRINMRSVFSRNPPSWIFLFGTILQFRLELQVCRAKFLT